ncbi:MAG: hypothetical protein KTR28_02870 [Micavibrio sp.]|nr:hypothetical protein [Micavibrio sp.]
MSQNKSAGNILVFLSIALVIGGAGYAYTQLFGAIPFLSSFTLPGGKTDKPRIITEGQQDFIDFVNTGLSSAGIRTGKGETIRLNSTQAAHLINQTYMLDVDIGSPIRALDFPEKVIAEADGSVRCFIEYNSSKSPLKFVTLLYKDNSGRSMAIIKKEKAMAGQLYDGQFRATTLVGAISAMTSARC